MQDFGDPRSTKRNFVDGLMNGLILLPMCMILAVLFCFAFFQSVSEPRMEEKRLKYFDKLSTIFGAMLFGTLFLMCVL